MSDARLTKRTQALSARRRVPAWQLKVGTEVREVRVGEVLRLGSNPGNDLVLEDETVSRIHAELGGTPAGLRVRDLGSTNGTFINDVPVADGTALPGMTVRLGQARVLVGPEVGPALEALSQDDHFGPVYGRSEPMRALFRTLGNVAQTSSTVLIQAESGSGKELVASALHAGGPRARGPYVVFDCAGVAPSLVESTLFGHEKGAFTGAVARRAGCFEEASGGTLFIDEVGELPLEAQPRLLRVLESRQVRRVGGNEPIPVDVRIIAATHRDLPRMVNAGQFREDLYYRLAVVRVRLPPLRERLEDVPLLVERLLLRAFDGDAARASAVLAAVSEAQWDRLRRYPWPGNVRELRNAIERSLALSPKPGLEPPSGSDHRAAPPAQGEAPVISLERPFVQQREALVEWFESRYLKSMLDKHEGNLSRAAAAAGMDRMYFKRRLASRGLLPKPD